KRQLFFTATAILLSCTVFSQQVPETFRYIDTALFEDNTHHWYDINEREAIIKPKPNQPRYKATQLKEVADNVLLYQKKNGG
ncbi:hypothetical protein, partial [Enterococcus faecium]